MTPSTRVLTATRDPSLDGRRPGLRLHRSDRVERLAAVLAEDLSASAPRDPVQPATVVVGSRGMERWLRARLAEHLGICTNVTFPFPAAVVRGLLADACGEGREAVDPWAPGALAWTVLARLDGLLGHEAFAEVRQYLATDTEGAGGAVSRRRWDLARQVADLLDRYGQARPDYVLSWLADECPQDLLRDGEERPDARWQRLLYRAVRDGVGGPSFPERLRDALGRLSRGEAAPLGLPAVHVFGLTSLPGPTLAALGALSARIAVHLYVFAPSPGYWADFRLLRRGGRSRVSDLETLREADERLEAQNPLLTALGRVSRDMQALLIDVESAEEPYDDRLFGPATTGSGAGADGRAPTVLERLQASVRGLEPGSDAGYAVPADPGDASFQVHACHGATRQVEVLRDRLLDLLAERPDLQPRDVLVMTPDVETFAPLVAAVFGDGHEPPRGPCPEGWTWGNAGVPRLPFQVADLPVRRTNPVADAVLRALELADSRATATAIADLLALGPVRGRFGIEEDDLPTVRGWLRDAGFRWGWDGADREREDQPRDDQNTFSFGLRRLALGVVVSDEDELHPDPADADGGAGIAVAPFVDLEGELSTLFGRFAAFCAALEARVDAFRAPAPPAEWWRRLRDAVEALTAVRPAAGWLREEFLDAVADLESESRAFAGPVSRGAMRRLLAGRFEVPSGGDRPLGGGVTVCALSPMRSVPFQVVCLLGMDPDVFPRAAVGASFDLSKVAPRPGDRDPRDEDRHLLLEALLSARSNLMLFYTGSDPKTGEARPPAVPVAELLDALDRLVPAPLPEEGRAPSRTRDAFTRRHPAQPFSPRAFAEGARRGTRGYDRRLLLAARTLAGPRTGSAAVLRDGPLPDRPFPPLDLAGLATCLLNPARFLLHRRLGVWLGESDDTLPDREPIELDRLAEWSIEQVFVGKAVEALASGREPAWDAAARAVRARGGLPLGTAGLRDLGRLKETAQAVAERAREHLPGAGPRPVSVTAGDIVLSGPIPWVDAAGDVLDVGSADPAKPKRLLRAWTSLLALQVAEPAPHRVAFVFGFDRKKGVASGVVLAAPEDPGAVLATLAGWARRAWNEAVPLLPTASHAFASRLLGVDDDWVRCDPPGLSSALSAASRAWYGSPPHSPGDCQDAFLAAVYRDREPWTEEGGSAPDEAFVRAAQDVWQPVLGAVGRQTLTRVSHVSP